MDDLNRRILGLLQADGRATFREIGEQVGLTAPAVKRRVDGMRARGEILRFTAVAAPEALGWDTEAYVEVHYRGNVSTNELARMLEAIPQVTGVWTVSGDADALVHVQAASMSEIESTVERIRSHSQVDRTRSAIVLSRVFQRERG